MMKHPKRKVWKEMTGEKFDSLPAAEKERIFNEIEQGTPEQRRVESTAPSAGDRARLRRVKTKMGRPKIGKGAKIVSITVEMDLLKQADAYARQNDLNRSQVFTHGLRSVLPAKAG
jgi:hypothetical protein